MAALTDETVGGRVLVQWTDAATLKVRVPPCDASFPGARGVGSRRRHPWSGELGTPARHPCPTVQGWTHEEERGLLPSRRRSPCSCWILSKCSGRCGCSPRPCPPPMQKRAREEEGGEDPSSKRVKAEGGAPGAAGPAAGLAGSGVAAGQAGAAGGGGAKAGATVTLDVVKPEGVVGQLVIGPIGPHQRVIYGRLPSNDVVVGGRPMGRRVGVGVVVSGWGSSGVGQTAGWGSAQVGGQAVPGGF